MKKIIFDDTIEVYKNNIEMLESLRIRIKSGSFNAYDIALYNALIEANKKDAEERQKKLGIA